MTAKSVIRNPADLIKHRLALKAMRAKTKEKALKTKTIRMIKEQCKKCGEWVLRVQKAANRNRWIVLDLTPLDGHRGRVSVYKKHQCGR